MPLDSNELAGLRADVAAMIADIGVAAIVKRAPTDPTSGTQRGTPVALTGYYSSTYAVVLPASERTTLFMTTYAGYASVGTSKMRTIKMPYNASTAYANLPTESDFVEAGGHQYQIRGVDRDLTNQAEIYAHAVWVKAL